MKKKIVFIGGGKTTENHIKVFKINKKFELSAIYNRTKKKAQKLAKKYKIKDVANSIKELIENHKPDLVIVSVSVTSIYKVTKEIIKYKSTVFLIEKPIGNSFAESEKLKKITNKNNKIFIGLNRRCYSSTRQALEILKKMNQRRYINIFDQQYKPSKIKNMVMFNNSIHLIDYAFIFARGRIEKIKNIYNFKNNSKIVLSVITYSSGDIVNYYAIWDTPGPWSVDISCGKIRIDLKPLEVISLRKNKNKKIFNLSISKDDKLFKPGYFIQSKKITNFILNKKTDLPNIYHSFKLMDLINKIYYGRVI